MKKNIAVTYWSTADASFCPQGLVILVFLLIFFAFFIFLWFSLFPSSTPSFFHCLPLFSRVHATLQATVSVGQSVGRSVDRSVGRSVRQSVRWSVCHLLLFFRKVAYSVACAQLMVISLVFFQNSARFLLSKTTFSASLRFMVLWLLQQQRKQQ